MNISRDGVTDFRGGLRQIGARRDLADNEVATLDNWRITLSGSLLKRWGSQKIHTTTFGGTVSAGYEWRLGNINTGFLMLQSGTHIYQTTSGGLAYPATFTDLGAVVANNFGSGMAGFRDGTAEVVYIGDGGPLNKWDATTFTANIASTPNVSQLLVYNRRLFGFSGDTLYWSDLDNGDTLGIVASGGGSARIRTFGNGPIVGLAVVGTTLFIFHSSGVSRFRGWSQDDIDINSGTSAVNNPVGARDWHGIAVFNGYAYWISPDSRAYRLSEDGDVEEIGKQVNLSFPGSPIAVANKGEREIWFRNVGNGSTMYVYNTDVGAWSTNSYIQGSSAWSAFVNLQERFADDTGTVLACSFDGFVYDLRYQTAALDAVLADGTGGSLYTATLVTNPFDFMNASVVKAIRYGYFGIEGANAAVTVQLVDETGALVGSGPNITAGPGVTRVQLAGNYKAPGLSLSYGGSAFASLSDAWLYGFVYNRP
jgi:hypothetical protein